MQKNARAFRHSGAQLPRGKVESLRDERLEKTVKRISGAEDRSGLYSPETGKMAHNMISTFHRSLAR